MKNKLWPLLLFIAFILKYNSIYAQLRIMPLGDSITEGVLLSANLSYPDGTNKAHPEQGLTPEGFSGSLMSGSGGYRIHLKQFLYNLNWDSYMVGQKYDIGGHYEGYPGYMSSDLLAILPDILDANPPDVILLHIGTNDLPWPINPDSCYANINLMLDFIHDFDPNIHVFLAQIIPCLQNTTLGQKRYPRIIELNDKFPQIARERSYVTIVDMWRAFTSNPDWETELMSGTWHPNNTGYRVMAEEWRDALEDVIEGRSPLVYGITPTQGTIFDSSYTCTITGDYFLNGAEIYLKDETGTEYFASDVTFQSSTELDAQFDLSGISEGNWEVKTVNPNHMRNIYSADVYFDVITDSATPDYLARINCGGNAYFDSKGQQWEADRAYSAENYGYIGGDSYATSDPIDWTNEDLLYKSERWGLTAYQFDVRNGTYRVILHFAEIYYENENRRSFDIKLNNATVLSDYDIYAEAGHDVATSKAFTVDVANEELYIEFISQIDVAKISAIEVRSILLEPLLTTSPEQLDFDSTKTTMSLDITNQTGEQLSWQLTKEPSVNWIETISPNSGDLNSNQTVTVEISATRDGIAAGNYSTQLSLQAAGENYPVNVKMNVPNYPVLTVTPLSLDFESDKNTLTFQVTNDGGSTLNWNAINGTGTDWVSSLVPGSGALTRNESETVTVTVNRDGLSGGEYIGTIQVTSNGGEQTVNVRIVVIEPPVLLVDPTEILFNGDQNSNIFIVRNNGGEMLNWYAAENPDQNWIDSVFPYSGVLGKGDSVAVAVNVNRSELEEGNYSGDILISSNGGDRTIQVELIVPSDPPVISLTPSQLDFDSTKNTLSFEIQNVGGDTLNWEISTDQLQTWISSISPLQGMTNKAGISTVTVEVNRLGLQIGEYSGNIFVNSNDRNVNLIVRMVIDELELYEQRVNCGSSEIFVDAAGNTWDADKAYSENDWGYVGGYVNSTAHEIEGTVDDALFQKERNAISEYKFDVMNDEYDVYLFFAEIYYNSSGFRVFDVEIEGQNELTNFDVYAEAGRYNSLGKKFTTDVNDGQLNIRFITSGEEPSISAIFIRTGGVISEIDQEEIDQIIHAEIPQSFRLYQNFPNPFKFNTSITMELPDRVDLKITIYNALGQQVQSHFYQSVNPGIQTFTIAAHNRNGELLPSGVYFYHIEAMGRAESVSRVNLTRKMILKK